MQRLLSTGTVLAATFGWLAALFAIQPFDRVNHGLDRIFGALPEWTQVENTFSDPATQEVSRGDHPLQSFRLLEQAWAPHPQALRIMLMGNSQTQAVSLARGEAPPTGPEKTYPDLLADHYRQAGSRRLFYRLSAGALSYQEMLWYATYLALRPALKPNVLVVQLNYQNFANGGIRAGMLELLSDPAFRHAIAGYATGGRPDADAFAEALHQYEKAGKPADPAAGTRAGAVNLGTACENRVRGQLRRIPGFERRIAFKSAFVYMLYRCRSYVLRIAAGELAFPGRRAGRLQPRRARRPARAQPPQRHPRGSLSGAHQSRHTLVRNAAR